MSAVSRRFQAHDSYRSEPSAIFALGEICYTNLRLASKNDGSDDYTDYDALTAKLPEEMKKPRSSSPADMKSFSAHRDWREESPRKALGLNGLAPADQSGAWHINDA